MALGRSNDGYKILYFEGGSSDKSPIHIRFRKDLRGISWLLDWPFTWVQGFLQWLPWSVSMALVAIVAHAAQGWRLAIFALLAMSCMLVTGYWSKSMNSLALVALSTLKLR